VYRNYNLPSGHEGTEYEEILAATTFLYIS
jgi:hypothetical protein